jgi:hypothetical protein
MGERLGVREVVRGYKLDIRIVQPSADNIPPDTAEAVDTYFDWHMYSSF